MRILALRNSRATYQRIYAFAQIRCGCIVGYRVAYHMRIHTRAVLVFADIFVLNIDAFPLFSICPPNAILTAQRWTVT